MAKLVNTLMGRPMQVAIVNGLNRYLGARQSTRDPRTMPTYAAPMAMLSHFSSFRGDVKSREEPASQDSAICISALAQRRSRAM